MIRIGRDRVQSRYSSDKYSNDSSNPVKMDSYEFIASLKPLMDQLVANSFTSNFPSNSQFTAMGVGSKIHLANKLCGQIKQLGYKKELAYSQILYPSARDIDDLTAFLSALLRDKALEQSRIEEEERRRAEIDNKSGDDINEYSGDFSMDWAGVTKALERWTVSSHRRKSHRAMKRTNDVSVEKVKEEVEEEDANTEQELNALRGQLRELTSRLARIESVITSRKEDIARVEARTKARDKARLLHQADADGNYKKLQEIVAASKLRLSELRREWDSHRVPLEAELSRATTDLAMIRTEWSKKQQELDEMKRDLVDARDRLASWAPSSGTHQQNNNPQKYVPGPGLEQRVQVVLKVLDAVKQLKKQETEMAKVVDEVKQVQAELSAEGERLVAVENELDDMIFAQAKTHPVGVQTYEFFVELVEMFDELMSNEKQKHLFDVELLDRISRTHSVAARVSALKIDQVLSDLKQIQSENEALRRQRQ